MVVNRAATSAIPWEHISQDCCFSSFFASFFILLPLKPLTIHSPIVCLLTASIIGRSIFSETQLSFLEPSHFHHFLCHLKPPYPIHPTVIPSCLSSPHLLIVLIFYSLSPSLDVQPLLALRCVCGSVHRRVCEGWKEKEKVLQGLF